MKKRALKKDFRMEVKKSLNRFLSIFFIVAMGVAFFSGIQASAPDMRYTGDAYFDDTNLMDVRVLGTLGLTEGDLEALRQLEGVESVEPGYMTDVLCGEGEEQKVLHVESLLETMNQLTLVEGKLPEVSGECFLDKDYMDKMGYQVGDTIRVFLDEDNPENASVEQDTSAADGEKEEDGDAAEDEADEDTPLLKITEYVIVGCGHSSAYLSFNRGSTTLGNGEVAGFMYILPEDFDSEVYIVAYLTVEGARDAVAYTEEYDQLVEKVVDEAEAIEDVRCEVRYKEVKDEAEEKLADYRQQVEDGMQELEDAREELESGKAEAESELAQAREDLETGESELEDGKQQLADSRQELEDARKQIADGEAEIQEKEAQLNDARQQLADGEAQLASAESQLREKQAQYDAGAAAANKELAQGQKELDNARTSLEEGQKLYDSKSKELEAAVQQSSEAAETLAAYQQEYDAGAAALAEGEASYASGRAALDAALAEYNANLEAYNQGKAAYDEGAAQLAQLQAGRDGANAQAAEYRNQAAALGSQNGELQQQIDSAAAQIGDLNGQISSLDSEIGGLNSQLAALQAELQGCLALPENEQDVERIQQLNGEIAGCQSQISAKESEKGNVQGQIDSLNGTINANTQTIQANQNAQAQAEAAAQAAEAQAAELEPVIARISAELEAKKPELDAAWQQLEAGKAQLDATGQQLDNARAELDLRTSQLNEAKASLDAGYQELTDGQAQIAYGQEQLAQSKQQLEQGQQEIEKNQKKIDDGKKQLSDGAAQLAQGWNQLNGSKSQLSSSRAQLADGESQLAQGKQTLADSKAQLTDGEQKIAEAESEIAENEQKLEDGWKEYKDGKKEADDQIKEGEEKIAEAESDLAEAQEKIEDAQKKVDEIEKPSWYVSDRSVLPEYSGYGENAERMTNIGRVFPVLFFLVAALISLTTMTRMVEEERTQIGTMKALGYSKLDIASKYMKYALYATLGGSVFGFLVGEKILPFIIVYAYGMMYTHMPRILVPYSWEFGLIATGAALVCTLGATLSACYRELAATPAVLMRPPAPKEGKRVWLEYLPFLWRRLGFTWKSTVRNLFRYKKRFFMTVIGIGGCMGLLLVGFGLNDSIMGIGDLQYGELQYQDAMVILDSDSSDQEKQELDQYLDGEKRIERKKKFMAQRITVRDGSREYMPYLYVPENTEDLREFMVFRDRISHEEYALSDESAIVTEKLASMLKLKVGDELTIHDSDKGDLSVTVGAIVENYLYHYIYMTPALYEKVYGEEADFNSIFLKIYPEYEEDIQNLGRVILAEDAALNVTYTSTIANQMTDMLDSLGIVIAVLIISAGMLAFVVLYNLNNININERKRELATIKVLGFYDPEVAAYVYRENILLTVIGAAVGILFGIFLHQYIITTVEVDACMFGRNINRISFVYGTLFTFGFSAFVNWVMYFKLKKIDMVESLKSVE